MDLHAAARALSGRKKQIKFPRTKYLRTTARPVALAIIIALAASSCGRAAPDDGIVAAPTGQATDDSQPQDSMESDTSETVVDVPSTEQMAGVRVVSDAQLVTATTVASATTPQSSSTTVAATAASTYVVEPGDTLSVIAERFDVPLSALSDANGIGDVDTIKPGQELIIPATG